MKNSQSSKNISGGVDKQVTFREKEWYKEKINEFIKQIDNEKFLKRIYISLRDYIKEE